jgi:hypothetical protein
MAHLRRRTRSAPGRRISTPTTFLGAYIDSPTSLALDSSNNIWVVNTLQGYVNLAKYSNDGQNLSGIGFTGGGLNTTYSTNSSGLTFDPSGDPLVNFGNVLTLFTPSGGLYSPGPAYPVSFNNNPVAYNGLGDLWYTSGGNDLYELLPTGTASTGSPFTGGGLNYDSLLVIGQGNSIFVVNGNNTLSIFDSTGVPITSSAIPNQYRTRPIPSPSMAPIPPSSPATSLIPVPSSASQPPAQQLCRPPHTVKASCTTPSPMWP